jgi:hypothetical protein
MKDKLELTAPKPLSCKIDGSVKEAVFDKEALRRFVEGTNEELILVEDASGVRALIRLDPIRRYFRRLADKCRQ